MTAVEPATSAARLQQLARDHLWLHFTRMSALRARPVPIIVSGDGCYLTDVERQALPRRAGRPVRGADRLLVRRRDRRGGARADARAALLHELELRASARDRARRGGRVARARRPQPRLLRLRRLRGGRVGLEARPPVARRQRRAALEGGLPQRRLPRHDDGRALDQRHRRRCARRSSRSSPRSATCRNTNRYHRPEGETEEEFTAFLLDDLEHTLEAPGPDDRRDGDHGAGAERGRRLRAAGRATSRASARSATSTASCSCADEVITGFGRLGAWFGSEKYDIRPDIVTCAKGLSSAYASIGAVIASDRVAEPFLERHRLVHARDHVRRPSRRSARSRSRTSRS